MNEPRFQAATTAATRRHRRVPPPAVARLLPCAGRPGTGGPRARCCHGRATRRGCRRRPQPRRRVFLPDVSRRRERRARHLPEVRHGARVGLAACRRRRGSRARGHAAPVLGRAGADVAAGRPAHCEHGRLAARLARWPGTVVAAAAARDAGGAVVRLAAARARLALDREPQPEHVHADRPRRGRVLRLQRAGDAGPGPGTERLPQRRRIPPCISSRPR